MDDWLIYVLIVGGILFFGYGRMKKKSRVYRRLPDRDFPREWRDILQKRVPFYKRLSIGDRKKFEYEIHVFLLNYPIYGKGTEITDLDRLLIAAGGVIPTFRLEKWHYKVLEEIHVFPDKFIIPTTDKQARGLVGWGAMEGQLWLSRKAVYQGFYDDSDQKNVAIHEFIHLMDMQDGMVDGIPEELMEEKDIPEWMELMNEKISILEEGDQSIREYAKTSPIEFLAATGEFYFESPEKMKSEHPKLYRFLDKIFNPTQNWF